MDSTFSLIKLIARLQYIFLSFVLANVYTLSRSQNERHEE